MYTGTQLLMARHALRLTTQEVASALKMSQPNINKIELGTANPTLSTLARLSTYYISLGIEFKPDGWVRLVKETPDV